MQFNRGESQILSCFLLVYVVELIFASFKLPVDLCGSVLASLKSVSIDVFKLIVASLKLSSKFFRADISCFKMLVMNCQLTYVNC